MGTTTPSAEVNAGWSRLCDGYLDAPLVCSGTTCIVGGFLTSDNRGDFGKLICSCSPNFAGDQCEVACPTRNATDVMLHRGGSASELSGLTASELSGLTAAELALYACESNNYCSLVPPDTSTGFTGGRQGMWLCGEFTETYPADPAHTNPTFTGTTSTSETIELRGAMRPVSVVRKPLTGGGFTAF